MRKTVHYSTKGQASQGTSSATRVAAAQNTGKTSLIILILCIAFALLLVLVVPTVVGGASVSAAAGRSAAGAMQQQEQVQLYDTVQQAMQAAGLDVTLPTALPQEFELLEVGVANGNVLQMTYANGADTISFRAAVGSSDLSGINVDEYSFTATEKVGNVAREYVGNSAERFTAAVWTDSGNSYALVATSEMDAANMRLIAEGVA